ncbi:MAG: T9SS type A sorting domain-containing protein [Bacteroidia bacterium]|nr:T9SS type A sorting domain-containing protein [Bacteroidia bacterium]
MKRKLLLLLALLALTAPSSSHAQKVTYGPHIINHGWQILIDGGCEFWVKRKGSGPPYAPFSLLIDDAGGGTHIEARFIVDWLIPHDSTMYPNDVVGATLRMEYFGNNLPDLSMDIWGFSTLSHLLDRNAVLSGMTGPPLLSVDGSAGLVEYTDFTGNFRDYVSDAVVDGHLTLAFALPHEEVLHDHFFNFDSVAIQLTIHYQDSFTVKITNVVNNIEDYDLEAGSLVRGDINIFSGSVALYSALPSFEPPYVTRNWRVNYEHIAETWHSKFEDPSLPRRFKFQTWDNVPDRSKVIYQTPPYDAVQRDFKAMAKETYPARHKARREIHHDYDGLSIAFRDAWRVAQTLNAGVPAAQTILDTYLDQVTPYAPWTDDQSWGVFLNIGHADSRCYGSQYWRYYEYDPGSDSYSRKNDAALEEGDLISMDEILTGKGSHVTPAGGIEVHNPAPGDDPFREYRLEYKDEDNTMDFYGVYKAHMLSDKESQPTRSANQRKIDIDPRGGYHLVYESAGEIWYVQSEDGVTWSTREELISAYTHNASNPSIAVSDSSIYITYMEGDNVKLKRKYNGVWTEYFFHAEYMNNGATTTPVIASGGTCYSGEGDIVVTLWDDHDRIRYCVMHFRYQALWKDDQVESELPQTGSAPPVSPSVTCDDMQTEFTACWREGTVLKCAEIHVGGGTCDRNKFYSYTNTTLLPDASFATDSVVFAPSITHNHEMKAVVAYEVKVPGIIYSDRWVNIRTYDNTSGTWNTTLHQIPYFAMTGYGEPISPSLGAHETNTHCGQAPEPGLRLAFHRNWGGGIRIGVIDCQYSEHDQFTSGECFPSVVPYAPNGMLRETFSAPFQTGPFMHALRTSNTHLSKQATPNLRLIRDLRVRFGDEMALLGVTDLNLRQGNNVTQTIGWHALPDSLVIGVDGDAHEILYTEPFTVSNGSRIDYHSIVYCSNAQAMPSGVSIAVQLRRASDRSLLHSFSIPLRNLPADTAMWTNWSRPLPQIPAIPVYISLGIDGALPAGAEVSNAKVWMEDQYIPKLASGESAPSQLPGDFTLHRNHPNPFNPGTVIPFSLGHDGHVRMSVHDVLGREVALLVNEVRSSGRYGEYFDAANLPSGTYICRLVFEGTTQSRSMLLVR